MNDPVNPDLYTPRAPVTVEDIKNILTLPELSPESVAVWARRSVKEIYEIQASMKGES